jgi:peroxiredoxin
MKIMQLILSFSLFVFWGCEQKIEQLNHFASTCDTLLLETNKIEGYGMLPSAILSIDFMDSTEHDSFQPVYPSNISDLNIASIIVDFKPFWYGNIKRNKSDYIVTFLKDFYPHKFDTLNVPSERNNSISIMRGQSEGKEIFIIDENNNKNFSDDSIRLVQKIDTELEPKLIKCNYNIYNGESLVANYGWINIGNDRRNVLSYSVAHHLESVFSIEDKSYKIEVVNGNPFFRFCFENPILALVEKNGTKKDSLLKSEILELGEYIDFNNSYYRFEDVSNDGRFITLIKEEDVSNKIGTQIGFIAPDFNCTSIEGDSIRLSDYKGKNLLLVNTTACWSTIMSYEHYKDLTQKYATKVDILGIDNSPDFLNQNIKDLNLTGKFIIAGNNKTVQNNYREDFCSRTCFLINQDGRIADKFEIGDWKTSLSKYFE